MAVARVLLCLYSSVPAAARNRHSLDAKPLSREVIQCGILACAFHASYVTQYLRTTAWCSLTISVNTGCETATMKTLQRETFGPSFPFWRSSESEVY
jgi:hypothetical protein